MTTATELSKTRQERDRVLVVLQLSGGNDFLNTVVPYGDGHYYDFRKGTGIPEEEVLKLDGHYGLHPSMGPIKTMWDEGRVAIIRGVGYPKPDRSHFRSMDIWHTAEPEAPSEEGWLGKVVRELDPQQQNVVTGVSFGPGLPRAMYLKGTPAMAVSELEGYGMLSSLAGEKKRKALKAMTRMYAPEEFQEKDVLFGHLQQTGRDAMLGADILRGAPDGYESTVKYDETALAQSMKATAQVHLARLGTRVLYNEIGGFDVHSGEVETQRELWTRVSSAIRDFFADLHEHDSADEVIMLVFSEFGRRIKDNGSGTDHGSGGGAFLIGDRVKGGMYSDYPSLAPARQLMGDLHYSSDFRSLYSSVLEQWFGLNPKSVVRDRFDQFDGIVRPLSS